MNTLWAAIGSRLSLGSALVLAGVSSLFATGDVGAGMASDSKTKEALLQSLDGRPRLAQEWADPSTGPRSESFKAIGYSALLPGLAQWNLGHRNRALGFWIAEAAFWTGFATYRVQGTIREDSYLEMATLHAGVTDVDSRDDDYLRRLSSWPSSDLYDDLIVRRDARTFSGDDPAARAAYFEENRIPVEDRWDWRSSADRERFDDKRGESKSAFKRSRNMIGLAVANRVVAMIDAVVLSNRNSDSAYRLQMEPRHNGEDWEGRLSLSRRY